MTKVTKPVMIGMKTISNTGKIQITDEYMYSPRKNAGIYTNNKLTFLIPKHQNFYWVLRPL